jgi:4'-phosphopantetheinyl transferase EntD
VPPGLGPGAGSAKLGGMPDLGPSVGAETGPAAGAGLLARLVPAVAIAAETRVDESPAELFPAEAELVARAVPKRQKEFTAGRVCARRALARLGIPPAPLLAGPTREPLWPAGVVGSITHCEGYRAAVVARATTVLSIGVDAEPNGPTPEGVLDRISSPAERAWIRAEALTTPAVHWDRLLFCAKEAVYKAWHPLTGTWLGFEDAHVTLDDPHATDPTAGDPSAEDAAAFSGGFTARLLVPAPVLADGRSLTTFQGRYLVTSGLILTAVTVSPRQQAEAS